LAVNRSLQPVQNSRPEFAECRSMPPNDTVCHQRCCTEGWDRALSPDCQNHTEMTLEQLRRFRPQINDVCPTTSAHSVASSLRGNHLPEEQIGQESIRPEINCARITSRASGGSPHVEVPPVRTSCIQPSRPAGRSGLRPG